MEDDTHANVTKKFEEALEKGNKAKYVLRLYVAGNTAKSTQAIQSIREICEKNLKGHYSLEVIDIFQQPELARGAQIVAAPTLVKFLPLPLRRIIGDLSSIERILVGLNIQAVDEQAAEEPDNGTENHHQRG